jgi:hypothetical protein
MSFTPPSGASSGAATSSWASVSSTTVRQNAAQRGSSIRAPSRNSGVCSDSSCSFSSRSQISATPLHSGSPSSGQNGILVSMRYFLICGILLAYLTACTFSQYCWNSSSVMPGLGAAKMS